MKTKEIRTIEFTHYYETVVAYVMYDFNENPNMLTVIPLRFINELGQKIFLIKKEQNWVIISNIIKNHPTTIESLLKKLQEFFRIEILFDHVFFLSDFSS